MDELDKALINQLQGGFPLSARPYAEVAARLGTDEADVLARLGRLLADGILSRFGPMYHAERLGGGLTLAAMAVPEPEFEAVTERVNAHAAVAHNYRREHALNMWFVIATETPEGVGETIRAIEEETGLSVFPLPKVREYFLGLRFDA